MKEPYYMIDFNAGACLFEIRVNDQPVLKMNLEGQASTRIPINNAIFNSGKQEVSVKMLPLLGQTKFSSKAELSYSIKLFDTVNDFQYKEQYDGFESMKIESTTALIITNTFFFNAEIPYKLKDYWKDGGEIKDIEDYEKKIRRAYLGIINLIKGEQFDLFSKKISDREYNIATSMYLSSNESNRRIQGLINDLNSGYDYLLFEEEFAIPVISSYGKKIALKKIDGDPALGFGNKEKREQLLLDIEFYFNKTTNSFEII